MALPWEKEFWSDPMEALEGVGSVLLAPVTGGASLAVNDDNLMRAADEFAADVPIVGDVLGSTGRAADREQDAAMRRLEDAIAMFGQGDYAMDPSSTVNVDRALSMLGESAQSPWTEADNMRARIARQQAEQQSRQQLQASLYDMAARGMTGSGVEAMMRSQANQGAANNLALQRMGQMAAAGDRQLQAQGMYGQQATRNQAAADAIRQFNASTGMEKALAQLNARTGAVGQQMQNAQQKKEMANQRIGGAMTVAGGLLGGPAGAAAGKALAPQTQPVYNSYGLVPEDQIWK